MHSNGSQAEISSRNAAITKYNVESLYAKKYKKKEKNLENAKEVLYTKKAVTLIAVKREVAAGSFPDIRMLRRGMAGFPWSECQVRKLATSHCITYCLCRFLTTHTGECTVTACRTGV